MKSILRVCFFLSLTLVLFLTSCTKENENFVNEVSLPENEVSLPNLDYSLENIQSMDFDLFKARDFVEVLYSKIEKEPLSEKMIEVLGDPYKNIELLAAVIIVKNLEYSDIDWTIDDEDVEAKMAGTTAYQWTGSSSRKWGFWCREWRYRANKKVAFVNPCSALSIKVVWRCCSNLTCSPYPSGCP